MKRWTWTLIGWLLLGWVSTPWAPSLWGAKADQVEWDLSQKKKDLNKVNKELSLTKEREKEIRGRESSVLESLSGIEIDLDKKGKELKEMER